MNQHVSVVIATFNRRDKLRAAIESVLAQTYSVSEILVCDDASSDGTQEMVRDWGEPRLRWIGGEHGGRPGVPRNRGLQLIQREGRADWVAILDDDDLWHAEKIEIQLREAKRHHSAAVGTNAFVVDGKGQISSALLHLNPQSHLTLRDFSVGNPIACATTLFKASLLDLVEGFPEGEKWKAIEDYALWTRIAALTDWLYINEPLMTYRDDAAHSVRRDENRDAQQIINAVSEDFIAWARRHRHEDERIAAALTLWTSEMKKRRREWLIVPLKNRLRPIVHRIRRARKPLVVSSCIREGRAVVRKRRQKQGFERDFEAFAALSRTVGVQVPHREDVFPCLDDATAETGFDAHYVYHPAWAARLIRQRNPEKHIDISSTLHFCSMLSAFIPVQFFDYRPANLLLSGLQCSRADLLELPFEDASLVSLSCMHVVEHIGLGRYGDPLDPQGDLKAMRELARVLAPGGQLLFVIPVGQARIQFNAHRIYSFEEIMEGFGSLRLQEWALLPDENQNGLLLNPDPSLVELQRYACGCFCFTKH